MDNKEMEIMEQNNRFYKRIFKSIFSTFIIFFISFYGIDAVINLGFGEMSPEQSDVWLIISLGIGIIFTIFYCTFTILEELKTKLNS